jgi:hypothetical protein
MKDEILKLKIVQVFAVLNIAIAMITALVSVLTLNFGYLPTAFAILAPWAISSYLATRMIDLIEGKNRDI